jgi:carboxylesterase type B
MDELVRDLHNDILNVTAVGDRDECVRGGAIRDEHHTRAARRGDDRKKRAVSVDTPLGRIVGFDNDKYTNAFLGIPYAEPPVGNFRYRPPRPKESWAPNTVRAMSFSPECLQSSLYSGDVRPNSEDCLYLNVWTPKSARYQSSARDKGELLPVMIWVYGGAFLHGGANKPEYEGAQLARRGVIIVSLNYRLGALGFLVSTVDGLYGNYGLADQKMAMMWVKQNIMSFGGDPNRVTVFGESAGAMSLGLHILDQHQRQQRQRRMREPQSSLFQAAILQSNPFGYRFRSVAVANFLGTEFKERLDCEDLRCLQSESADELIHVQDTLMAVPRNIGDFFTWGPVVTDEHFWREFRLRPGPWANVTVRHPLSVVTQLSAEVYGLKYDARQRFLEEGDYGDEEDDDSVESQVASNHRRYSNSYVEPLIPMVIGTTKDEGTVFVFTAYPTVMPRFMYQAMVFGFFRFDAPRVLKQYAALSREQQLSPHPDYRLVLSVIIGDYLFKCPTQLFATMATTANSSVYLFEFSLPTKVPDYPCCDGLSCHTSELPYVFNHLDIINDQYSWQDDNEDVNHDYDLLRMMMVEEEDSWGDGGGGNGGSDDSTTKTGKKSWYEMATQFFSGGKRKGGSGYDNVWEDDGGENRPRRNTNNDAIPARSAIDANISDIMANYWVNFASSHDPNVYRNGGEDDSDSSLSEQSSLNAMHRNGAPLWVTLNGFAVNRRGWGIERGDRGDGIHGGGEFDDDFDGRDIDVDAEKMAPRGKSAQHRHQGQQSNSQRSSHARYGADLQRKMRLKSSAVRKIYNHQLVLDSITEMSIIGEDCNCRFWNDYQYKF